jgi:hypothetical protein
MKIREFYANESTIQGFANSGVTPKTTQLIINTLQGEKRENVKLFLLTSYHLYPNFDKHTPLIINQKTIIIMKRFFIFAAMLLSLTMSAFVLPDEPPLILPGTEDFVTTPTNMHDIDRSIPRCIYTYIPERGTIDFYCEGIGNADFYVVDQNGCTFDYARLDSSLTNNISLRLPDAAGIYYIYLRSESRYGEAMIIIE